MRFTTFIHFTMFYCNRKVKRGATTRLDLTKYRLDIPVKAKKYVKDISNVDFAYSDINCHLKA